MKILLSLQLKLSILLGFSMATLVIPSAHSEVIRPTTVELKALDIYAPKGFDSNDNVEVVVTGYLPNLCYQSPQATAVLQGRDVSIKLTALLSSQNIFCPMVIVPFHITVSLGVLQSGDYQLKSANGEKSASLTIEEATSPVVDQFIYAQVSHLETDADKHLVTIHAVNPSVCLEYKGLKLISSSDKKVLSVLPIMEKVKEFCPLKPVAFTIDFTVPEEAAKENLLLHVRSMEGKSVNAIYNQFLE